MGIAAAADVAGLRARILAWAAGCGLPAHEGWRIALGVAGAAAAALARCGTARVDFALSGPRLEVTVRGAAAGDCDPARREDSVVLGWALPAPCPEPFALPGAAPADPGAEDEALLDLLAAHEAQVRALTAEIEATSHGLIAVHAELDEARQAEARLAAIVQSSGDAMYTITPDLVVATWNLGAQLLLGYSPGAIVGHPVAELIPATAATQFADALNRLRNGERAVRYDGWRRHQDGSLVEVGVTLSAIRDEDGQLIGYAAVLHDLTERRRIQAEIEAARARAEVMAERERIAQDLHDLVIQRLYASGMFLQLALRVKERGELDARIERVIDDLDATIAEIRSTIFSLGRPVAGLRRQVLELATDAAAVMGFKPRVHFEGPVDTLVPPEVAEQVLAVAREALSNIARHAHASDADLTLRAGEQITLEVADDGRGMGDTTRASGLANMRRRAAALGGTLEVQSEPGMGTRLVWRVPLHA